MNVLSLFDGISCGQVALERAGIKVAHYFASESDKFAIAVTQFRYPDTIQLGNVEEIDLDKLPKIDLLIGGPPCQGFSFAGKGLNFEDPRSKLIFKYIEALTILKPEHFLLENVKMKKEFKDKISALVGVEPIEINSARVSAQNRKRLYWNNIPGVVQPEDKYIYLKDIIESGFVDREKSYALDANYQKGGDLGSYKEKGRRQLVFNKPIKLKNVNPSGRGQNGNVYSIEGKSPTLTTNKGEGVKVCFQVGVADIKGLDCKKRVYSIEGKSPTLTTMGGGHREPKIAIGDLEWRKLTPLECERLQTLPDNYTLVPWQKRKMSSHSRRYKRGGNGHTFELWQKRKMSNSQRYKQCGNGWTVDVIAHIFKELAK